ncbi:MAG: IclR family transcriptional regulator [Oscillospiraceae bacterium]|nr:IclR family transcriptional regulator [Oscillospiraceae bacterium]
MASADASVKVIERALKMLNCFTKEKLSLSLVEIAREIDLPPSTTSRILATLEKYNYLYRDEETQRYYLGPSIARLGTLCYSHMDFRRISIPYMIQLRELYNESVGLYVPNKEHRVCIERIESTHPLKRILNIGDRLPLTRGASGRLLLAYQPPQIIDELLAADPYTTVERLAEIRALGYSTSRSEREEGVVSVAAPIFDSQHKVVAALNISGPAARINMELMQEMALKAKEFALKISQEMGY